MSPPSAVLDPARLRALDRSGLVDCPPDAPFERLTQLAARVLGTPLTLVSLVAADRQVEACAIGRERRSMPLSHSFCKHVVEADAALVVTDAREHPLVADNPATAQGVVAYVGVPVRSPDGHVLGSLCAVEPQPRKWTLRELETLDDVAAALTTELSLREEIEGHRRAEAELAESKALLAAILDNSPTAIYAKDLDGRYAFVNERFETRWDIRRDEVIGRRDADLFPADLAAAFRGTDQAALERGAPVELIESDGASSSLTVRFPLVRDGGEPYGVCGVSLDITALRRAQEEAHRLKDQFFALVSHELRTPLASVLGYCEILSDEQEDLAPDHRRCVAVIERNAQRLMRLVGDLMFVAQFEAGGFALAPGDVDLHALATAAVDAAAPHARDLSVRLSYDGAPVPTFQGDEGRLGQALDNLISNACKFTPRGGQVEVRLERAGECAVLAVSDTGTGIPYHEQERVFERFTRASTAGEIPGVGLGLTIVKAIAEAHGGWVDLKSRPGSGTTFRVFLPLGAA